MAFKLVRVDAEAPCKIQLFAGTHLLGRGKFLNCDDKRVSRNHGEIQVTHDSVVLKSLHANPCFYTKKGNKDYEILKNTCTATLNHGDKFGLLPDTYWYEVIYCPVLDDEKEKELNQNVSTTDTNRTDDGFDNSQEPLDFDINDNTEENNSQGHTIPQGSPSFTQPETNEINNSPSIIPDTQDKLPPENKDDQTDNHTEQETEQQPTIKQEPTENDNIPNVPKSPLKRSHSSDNSNDGAKKIKTEDQVKQESDAQPGPSVDQGQPNGVNAVPPSPVKPAPAQPPVLGRERCMYGASCYRKNPQHKAQFSHPGDADWGTGERGRCPYGAGCRRADPRHWRDHAHPPGAAPPANRPPAVAQKQKRRKKRVSASSEDDETSDKFIITGKRQRKTIERQEWSESETEDEDPFKTDESDEWQPDSQMDTQSQYTQDF